MKAIPPSPADPFPFLQTHRPRTHRPAFAAVTAIILIGLIGVALAILASSVANDARRLRTEREQAQARQLLLATHALVATTPNLPQSLDLPAPLREQGAAVTLSPPQPDGPHFTTHVTARVGTTQLHETLTLTRQDDHWSILQSHLGD